MKYENNDCDCLPRTCAERLPAAEMKRHVVDRRSRIVVGSDFNSHLVRCQTSEVFGAGDHVRVFSVLDLLTR